MCYPFFIYYQPIMRLREFAPDSPSGIQSSEISKPLYHLSFDGDLEGIWTPRNPYGRGIQRSDIAEPDLPRISVAPTVKDCFRAIYPNVSQYFEIENFPHMEFFVYRPQFNGDERVLTPKMLTTLHMVHDAHVTHEYCILDDVYMKLVAKIKIFNTNDSRDLMYRPYGVGDKRYLAPRDIKWEKIDA